MSIRSSAPRGALLSGVGALGALASLWLPWYTIKFPDSFRDALSGVGSGAAGSSSAGSSGAGAAGDAFAGLFKGLAAVLPTEITGKGWQVMSGGDIALAVAAGAVLLLLVAVGGGASGVRVDRGVAGRLIALAGLVVIAIALYHVVSKPGAGAGSFSSIVSVKFGIAVAAAGGLLMLIGGLLTARPPQVAALEPALSPAIAGGVPEEGPRFGAEFAPPEAAIVPEPEPEPFAVPSPEPYASPEPFASPAPEPYASPEPFASPAPEPYASPEPFASPAPEPYASPEPFASPAPEPYASPEPFASPAPEPYVAPEPFALPAEPVAASEPEPYGAFASAPDPLPGALNGGTGEVPDWTGFHTPTPDPVAEEAARAASAHTALQSSVARPDGVSIPPPGWTGG